MKKSLKSIPVILCALLLGCRGVESHTQDKSTAIVDGQELHMDARLSKQMHATDQGFDLSGTIEVSSPGRSVTNQIDGFTLKPHWEGFPWYFGANFVRNGNTWERSTVYTIVDTNFFGSSRTTNGVLVINFTWRNQGTWKGSQPEHFAAYDVSTWAVNTKGEFHVLKKRVPTE